MLRCAWSPGATRGKVENLERKKERKKPVSCAARRMGLGPQRCNGTRGRSRKTLGFSTGAPPVQRRIAVSQPGRTSPQVAGAGCARVLTLNAHIAFAFAPPTHPSKHKSHPPHSPPPGAARVLASKQNKSHHRKCRLHPMTNYTMKLQRERDREGEEEIINKRP